MYTFLHAYRLLGACATKGLWNLLDNFNVEHTHIFFNPKTSFTGKTWPIFFFFYNEISWVHNYTGKIMHHRKRERDEIVTWNSVTKKKNVHNNWNYLFVAAALPLCLSPSSASLRTTTSTDASSVSCCLSGQPSTWTAPHSTRLWQQSSLPKWTIMSWTLDRLSQSGKARLL